MNFLHQGGNGVSDGVVSAITGIAIGSTFDISATIENDPSNPDGLDATVFFTLSSADATPPALLLRDGAR